MILAHVHADVEIFDTPIPPRVRPSVMRVQPMLEPTAAILGRRLRWERPIDDEAASIAINDHIGSPIDFHFCPIPKKFGSNGAWRRNNSGLPPRHCGWRRN